MYFFVFIMYFFYLLSIMSMICPIPNFFQALWTVGVQSFTSPGKTYFFPASKQNYHPLRLKSLKVTSLKKVPSQHIHFLVFLMNPQTSNKQTSKSLKSYKYYCSLKATNLIVVVDSLEASNLMLQILSIFTIKFGQILKQLIKIISKLFQLYHEDQKLVPGFFMLLIKWRCNAIC